MLLKVGKQQSFVYLRMKHYLRLLIIILGICCYDPRDSITCNNITNCGDTVWMSMIQLIEVVMIFTSVTDRHQWVAEL